MKTVIGIPSLWMICGVLTFGFDLSLSLIYIAHSAKSLSLLDYAQLAGLLLLDVGLIIKFWPATVIRGLIAGFYALGFTLVLVLGGVWKGDPNPLIYFWGRLLVETIVVLLAAAELRKWIIQQTKKHTTMN